jgi:hypothetical protein
MLSCNMLASAVRRLCCNQHLPSDAACAATQPYMHGMHSMPHCQVRVVVTCVAMQHSPSIYGSMTYGLSLPSFPCLADCLLQYAPTGNTNGGFATNVLPPKA